MDKGKPKTPEEQRPPAERPTRWQVAVHEAAHAVRTRAEGMVVKLVTVEGIVARESGGERCE